MTTNAAARRRKARPTTEPESIHDLVQRLKSDSFSEAQLTRAVTLGGRQP